MNERGFTTVELLVAVQLSLIVISLAYLVYLLSLQLTSKWQEKIWMENQLSAMSLTLSKSLDRICEVSVATDTELLARKTNGESFHLTLDRHIRINTEFLGDSTLSLQKGAIQYWLAIPGSPNRSVAVSRVENDQIKHIRAVQLDLIITYKQRDYPLEIFHRLVPLSKLVCFIP